MSGELINVDAEELRSETSPVIAAAYALVVTDVVGHRLGLELLSQGMAARDMVRAKFKPAVDAAMESKRAAEATRKEIVGLQDSILDPIIAAIDVISKTCGAFEVQQRREAEEKRLELEAEAIRKQEEQRELDAAFADTAEEAEEVLTEPLAPPPVPTVRPEVARVAGVTGVGRWSGEITDKKLFVAWCLEHDHLYFLEVNMGQLNSRARAERQEMNIPGAKAVETRSHARR